MRPVPDRRKAFPPARFTVVLEATARSTFRTLLVSRTAAPSSCTRRAAYVERLWSGSCSPRRAISARLQAQCRPSVSPVGQSLRAVGRSGVGSFSALLLRRRSAAPLLRSAPCSTTGRIHSHRRPLLAVLSDQLRWLLPAVVQGLAENAHVELLRRRLLPRRGGGLLPRRAGARTELSGRTHDTAREGRPARGRSSARQNPARRCCSRQVDTNCARPACCTAAARAPTYAARVPGCRSALLSRWSRLRAGYARARGGQLPRRGAATKATHEVGAESASRRTRVCGHATSDAERSGALGNTEWTARRRRRGS